ncbi:MAG TPA: MFS transporter, partial [Ktedonobacterales bacterium]
ADVARAVLTGALAGLVLVGNPLLCQLCAVSALLGAFSGLFMPGSFSILPDVLPDEQLQAGNAFNSSSAQLATLVGAGIAGAVVTFFTPGTALAVDAGTFAVSALTLATMRPRALASPTAATSAPQAAEGAATGAPERAAQPEAPPSLWRWLATSRLFQVILLIALIGNLTIAGVAEVALPQVAKTLPGGGAGAFGILLAAFGVGALVGGLGAGALGGIRGRGVLMMLIWIVQGVVIALIPFAGSVAVAAGAVAGMGLTNALSNVIAFTAIQQKTPRALLGRVMSVLMLTGLASYPLSVAAAGVVTQRYGPAMLFVVCGALLVAATIFGLFQRELRAI